MQSLRSRWIWFGYKKSDLDLKIMLYHSTVPSTDWNSTKLFNHPHYYHKVQREYTDEGCKSTVKCAEHTPQHTIWPKVSCKQIMATVATYICKDMAIVYMVKELGIRELTPTTNTTHNNTH